MRRKIVMNINSLTEKALVNWPAKIVCLALSLLLFLFYRMSTLEERYFSVPLGLETNGDLVPASSYPRTVKITLRGENDRIYPILEQDIVAFADLSRFTNEGEYRVGIQTRLSGTALEVSPLEVSVDPAEISLRVEHKVIKKVPVTPSFKGYPEAGYEFIGYAVNPSVLEVSGPRSASEKILDLVTETIELSGRNASFNGEVSLINRNPLVSVAGPSKVVFQVHIEQTTLIRNFEDVPFYFENLDASFEVIPSIVSGSLQLKGAQKELSGLTLAANALTVLCEHISEPGVYSLPVQVIIPDQFEAITSSPRELQVVIQRRGE